MRDFIYKNSYLTRLLILFFTTMALISFSQTSTAKNTPAQTSLAQWITANTNHYENTQPSPGTSPANISLNLSARHYQLEPLIGNAALILLNPKKTQPSVNITWQDGTQSVLASDKFMGFLRFLATNHLGLATELARNYHGNFGGVLYDYDKHNNIALLIYNLDDQASLTSSTNLNPETDALTVELF